MHILITGGAGFIGSHLAERLLAAEHAVTVIDNLATGRLATLPDHPRLTFRCRDVADCGPEDLPGPVDGLAHLAATASVAASWRQPLAVHHNNLSVMVAVLELCRALTIPRVVFASSAAVYGAQRRLPVRETAAAEPLSPYGLQKLTGEHYGRLWAAEAGFAFVALRLFNVYGPRQSADSDYAGVISAFAGAMRDGQPIGVYGDGGQSRDFVYVDDAASAFVQALTAPLAAGSATVCNIGTGRRTSLLGLIERLRPDYPNWRAEVRFAPPRPGDIRHSQADIAKAARELSFTPGWTVDRGLEKLAAAMAKKV